MRPTGTESARNDGQWACEHGLEKVCMEGIGNMSTDSISSSTQRAENCPGRNRDQAGKKNGAEVYMSGSKNFARRVGMFVIFIVAPSVLLLGLAHDVYVEVSYVRVMKKIGRQIVEYADAHNRLPAREEVLALVLDDGMLDPQDLSYDDSLVLGQAHRGNVLACIPARRMILRSGGYIVLWLNGKVEWASGCELCVEHSASGLN